MTASAGKGGRAPVADRAAELLAEGAAAAAERLCRDAIAAGEQHPRLRHVLGLALQARGALDEAEAQLARAAAAAPEDPVVQYNLGVVLGRRGRAKAATMAWRQATRLKPDYDDAWFNLAKVLGELGLAAEAEIAYGRLLALRPDHAPGLYNLGNLRHEAGRYRDAIEPLRRATLARPDYAEAHANLSLSLAKAGQMEPAIEASERAIALAPTLVDAHWNYAQILLLAGRLEPGFEAYEWRWRRPETPPRDFSQPPWDGGPLDGRTLLLHAEQGLGDTIQFARYAPLARDRGGRVLLEAHPGLVWLLRGIAGVDQVIARGDALPGFDCHAPLLSLPRLFATSVETIPAEVPYLRPLDAPVARWAERLGQRPGRRVGLCWHGSPDNRHDRQRSLPLSMLAPLAEIPGLRLISLQKGTGEAQLDRLPPGFAVERLGDDFDAGPDAFRDTVAVLHGLDLVITVDTALAHLAGALALPAWLLLSEPPDWRWMRNRADSPWYPTLRLFRQPAPGDWAGASEALREALAARLGAQ